MLCILSRREDVLVISWALSSTDSEISVAIIAQKVTWYIHSSGAGCFYYAEVQTQPSIKMISELQMLDIWRLFSDDT